MNYVAAKSVTEVTSTTILVVSKDNLRVDALRSPHVIQEAHISGLLWDKKKEGEAVPGKLFLQ